MAMLVDETTEPENLPAIESAGLTTAACLFHAFGDAHRLTILRHLTLGEHRVVDLTRHLGLAQSTVSKHLACLRDCGLVTSRPQGRASMWSLNHPEAIVDLLAAGERLLSLTGDQVTLCASSKVCPTGHDESAELSNDRGNDRGNDQGNDRGNDLGNDQLGESA
ncbi:ArsR/SmtB family transcription factor [Aestuariimicrobium soli]|uniref:ArsR/SmtB family transcription factor n=1 Tax=Aestuariimicrobium soli TaxID=2035834 RepID=UPI003EBF8BEE